MWKADSTVCQWYSEMKFRHLHEHPCIVATITGADTNGLFLTDIPPQPQAIDVNYVKYQIIGGLDRPYLTYLHIIRGGTVDFKGNVFGSNYKIIGYNDALDYDRNRPAAQQQVSELFVISHIYGDYYYHALMEELPRLVPYLPFLRRNPQIRIHLYKCNNCAQFEHVMNALGIAPSRIIYDSVNADVIYLPKSSGHMNASIFENQLLAQELVAHINTLPLTSPDDIRWNSIVLIKRSGLRRFQKHDEIMAAVQQLATQHGYRLVNT